MASATPGVSAPYNYEEQSGWAVDTLGLTASRTVLKDSSSPLYHAPRKCASLTSIATVKSASSVQETRTRHRTHTRQPSVKDILVKSLTFVTMLPRISSARSELAFVQRSTVPAPLCRQAKVLDDLLELTKDELPYQMRRSALRLIQFSFGQLVQDMFTASTRRYFISALKELCSEELSYSVRKEGLSHFNYLIGAGANLNSKNFALEHEECRAVLNLLKATAQVSLKFAACAYLWLACRTFRGPVYSPLSETELRDVCLILVNLTQHPFLIETRKDALDWLWCFEDGRHSSLANNERREVWMSILEISRYTESIGFPLHGQSDSEIDCISGLHRLWWFSILGSWTKDMQHDKKGKKKVGVDLFNIISVRHPHEMRAQGFELIALFSNLTHWRDMYDEGTWRRISSQFVDFCLRDTKRVNKDGVMRRVESLLVRSSNSESSSGALTVRKELQVTRRRSVTISRQYSQFTAAKKAVCEHCGPGTSVEATLENLAVFTLPGESVLIQKDQQAILYERICNYAKFDQTRLIAVQAMYALLTIQEWLSGISFAKGPLRDA